MAYSIWQPGAKKFFTSHAESLKKALPVFVKTLNAFQRPLAGLLKLRETL